MYIVHHFSIFRDLIIRLEIFKVTLVNVDNSSVCLFESVLPYLQEIIITSAGLCYLKQILQIFFSTCTGRGMPVPGQNVVY